MTEREGDLMPSKVAYGQPLSRRQIEVMNLLLDGLSNQEIADRLFVSVCTVRNHLHAVNVKLGTSSRLAAALTYQRMQWEAAA